MSEKKYKLTDTTIEFYGVTLHQIEALVDFGDVKKGQRGGYVQSERNLSHKGDCWIHGNACVYSNAVVSCDARVYGNANVSDNASVYGGARVFGNARVYGGANVCDNVRIYGTADVYGTAEVSDNARVFGNADVYGNVRVYGCSYITGSHNMTPFQLHGTRHFLNVDYDDDGTTLVQIGCHRQTLTKWLKNFKDIGKTEGYSDEQIFEYGEYLKLIKKLYGTKRKEVE